MAFRPLLSFSLLAGMASFGLAGCADDTPWSYDAPHPVVATPDSVSVRLADAADKASQSLQTLAAIEQERTPAALPPITPVDPHDDLTKPISVAWTGPASPMLQRLAVRVGYQFQQIGTPPTEPVTVSINVIEQPVLEVLRDAGMQMGSRANLVVDANRHVVELQYAANQ